MEAAGIGDILTKSLRSTNPYNLVRATFDALEQLMPREKVAVLRRAEETGEPVEADVPKGPIPEVEV
jgi:SSU ribosomal protein S5P